MSLISLMTSKILYKKRRPRPALCAWADPHGSCINHKVLATLCMSGSLLCVKYMHQKEWQHFLFCEWRRTVYRGECAFHVRTANLNQVASLVDPAYLITEWMSEWTSEWLNVWLGSWSLSGSVILGAMLSGALAPECYIAVYWHSVLSHVCL